MGVTELEHETSTDADANDGDLLVENAVWQSDADDLGTNPDTPDRPVFWSVMAVTAMGLVLRLWDLGGRAMHHDESLDAWWSWKFIDGTYDGYDPVFHGPLRFYITGAFYLIFGESPTTARLFSALSGAALIALPWVMRHHLGRVGTVATAAFLAISPSMLYFSRFGREDAQMMFLAGAMIVLAVAYMRKPNAWYPLLFALALSASFAIKESAFLWVGIVGSFGMTMLIVQYERLATRPSLMDVGVTSRSRHQSPFADSHRESANPDPMSMMLAGAGSFVCLVALVVLIRVGSGPFQVLLLCLGLGALLVALWMHARALGEPWAGTGDIGADQSLPHRSEPRSFFDFEIIFPLLSLMGLLFAILVGNLSDAEGDHYMPGGVFLMLGVYGFFMFLALGIKLVRALASGASVFDAPIAYRLQQVGAVPWIVAVVVFIVTFIAFFTVWFTRPQDWFSGVTKAIDYWNSQQDVNRGGQPWYYYLVAIPAYEWCFILLALASTRRMLRERTFAMGLLVWTTVASLILYSYAGERMPWLIVHPLLPILFIAGLGANELWRHRRNVGTMALIGILVLGFLFTIFTSIRASFVTDTDGRELFVQAGQATEHVVQVLEEIEELDRISQAYYGRPLNIGLGADDAWPWAYYFHDRAYTTWDSSLDPVAPEVDVLITNNFLGKRGDFFDPGGEMPNHQATRFAMRVWWVPSNMPDANGSFSASVTYFDTNDDNLLPTRALEWVDWIVTKDATWEYSGAGGCGSVDQWFMVSNELLDAAGRIGSDAGRPDIEKVPCASNEMSTNVTAFETIGYQPREDARNTVFILTGTILTALAAMAVVAVSFAQRTRTATPTPVRPRDDRDDLQDRKKDRENRNKDREDEDDRWDLDELQDLDED